MSKVMSLQGVQRWVLNSKENVSCNESFILPMVRCTIVLFPLLKKRAIVGKPLQTTTFCELYSFVVVTLEFSYFIFPNFLAKIACLF